MPYQSPGDHILESLFGGSSRGAAATRIPLTEDRSSSIGMVVLFDRARSFGRDAHGVVREEGDTRLASQISRINPGDQWVTDVATRSPSHPGITFLISHLLWDLLLER